MATETVAPPLIPTTDDDQQVEKKVCEEIKAVEECAAPTDSAEEVLKTDDSICLEKPAADHEKIEPVEAAETLEDETTKDEGCAAETVEPISIAEKVETEEAKTPSVEVKEVTQDEVGLEKCVEDEKKEVAEVDLAEKIQEETAVVKQEEAKETDDGVVATEPIKEDEKEVLTEVETTADEASEKPVTTGEEENVETPEIDEKEISNVVTEEPTLPIEVDEKKECGVDVVEKVTEEVAVEAEKPEEKNVETVLEDQKKDLCDADVIEKVAYAEEVKLEDVEEENVVKIAETEETEKKDETFDDTTQPITADDQKIELNEVDEADEVKVQSEESDIKTVLEEVSTQQDKADANSYISTTPSEVIEKSFPENVKDVEPVAEAEKEEHVKVETPCAVETKEENDVKVTTLVTEPLEAAKCDESVALEKTTEDVAESDRNIDLPAKDSDETKPSENLSTEEVAAKTSQKQSSTILSKVKHTLVKAKRVITGKSPRSKTPASETKEEVKVK